MNLIPSTNTNLEVKIENKDDNNSCILIYYQIKPVDFEVKCRCIEESKEEAQYLAPIKYQSNCPKQHKDGIFENILHRIVFKLLDVPAFEYLRTEKQLGYIAYALQADFNDIHAGGFVVQSSDYSPDHIEKEIFTFLKTFEEKFDTLTDEEYQKAVKGVLGDIKNIDMNINDEHSRFWRLISEHSYMFDIKEKRIEILETMMNNENQDAYNHYKECVKQRFINTFLTDPKMITIKTYSHEKYEAEIENSKTEDTSEKDSSLLNQIKMGIDDIRSWKHSQNVYPDVFKSRWYAKSKDMMKFTSSKL